MKKKLLIIIPVVVVLIIAVCLIVDMKSDDGEKAVDTNDTYTENQEESTEPEIEIDNTYPYSVVEVTNDNLVVAEINDSGFVMDTVQFLVPNLFYPSTEIEVGDEIVIHHSGEIVKAYPMIFTEVYTMELYDKETGESVIVRAE